MNFGEEQTKGGIILTSDDGKDHGIKPRWAKVYAKGDENKDEYNIGDWILIEHGRWTRGYDLENEDGDTQTLRTVEAESVLLWSTEHPSTL
jgi:co-chaperonin GroES (HSP10)